MRRTSIYFFKILLFSLIVIFTSCNSRDNRTLPFDSEEGKIELECSRILKDGENLDFILQEMALVNNERYKITQSIKEYLDLKTCMPGDSVVVAKDISGNFISLEYIKNPFLKFMVSKVDTGYKSEKIEIPPSVAISYIEGTISSSLYESLIKIGESPEVVFAFADIFAWVIDFLTEVQTGDIFEIVLERKYLGNRYVSDGKILAAAYKGMIGTYYAFYFKGPDGKEDYYDEKGNSLRKQLLKTPLQYRRVSSYFSLSRYHPILKYRRPHYGVDFAAPYGTPVSCVGDGHILFAGWKGGYGKLIVVNHPNSFITYYGHLSRIKKGMVKGTQVKQGQIIGYVGSTGISTGPHLHFGIKKSGRWINPLKVDLPPAEPVNEKYRALYMKEMIAIREAMMFLE